MKNMNLKFRILERFGNQFDFARLLGMTENRLSRIICGRQNPGEPEKELIAQKLGVPLHELFS